MTDKQLAFIEHYCIDLNGTQACIRAGYATTYAGQQAAQLLADPDIHNAIKERRALISENTGVDVDFVAVKAKQVLDRCMQVEPVMEFDGEDWVQSGEYKFDSSGANKAIDTLAKITGAYDADNKQKTNLILTHKEHKRTVEDYSDKFKPEEPGEM